MSNVTAREIMDLTAETCGVLVIEMTGRGWSGCRRGEDAPRGLRARQIAAYLIRRHTRASCAEVMRLFALDAGNAHRGVTEMTAACTRRIASEPGVRELVDRIEDKIDALHESRVARMLEAAE